MLAPHDLSHCHDEECSRSPSCWRYTTRLTHKWARHELSLRPLGDSSGRCPFFMPADTPAAPDLPTSHPLTRMPPPSPVVTMRGSCRT